MSSLSLLNAAGLAMCDPEPLEDGMLDHNAYGAQHAVDEDGSQERKAPCPWACTVGEEFTRLTEEELHTHLKQGSDSSMCAKLSSMLWEANTKELLTNLSQLISSSRSGETSSARLDPQGRFHQFTTALLLARSVVLDVGVYVIPYTISKYMWEWATTARPDSPAVVNSFQNKLQHQPTMDALKLMHGDYRPSRFYQTISKGKSEKVWRPLHEWMIERCLGSKYIFFKLEHPLRKAGDSVMVVLTVSKKVAICFDPKCMSLDGDERSKRDSEIYASVSRMLSTMTKKFHRNLLKDSRRQWDEYMEQPLAVYVYASPWLEHLVKQVAVDQNEFVLELLVLSFYYRCAMQETVCYQECPTETLPVPTFFLEAVSDIGCLLTDATGPDGKPTDLFWRELIEWGLSRTTYETIFINNNGDSTMAPVTDLLLQGAHVGRSPQIPARAQVASMEHEFRLVEPFIQSGGDNHEGFSGTNSLQDGIPSSFGVPTHPEMRALAKSDGYLGDSLVDGQNSGERTLRPVAARKSGNLPDLPITPISSNSKRKSAVPSKTVPRPAASPSSPKRRKPEATLLAESVRNDPYDFDSKGNSRQQNGHPQSKRSAVSHANSLYMPPSLPSASSTSSHASTDHKFQSEVTAKVSHTKSHMEPEYFHAAYQCLVCPDYGAAELSMMKDHVREHLGLSPYECYHCHKNFTCVRTFKAHAEVLGIPYFRCTVCEVQSDDEHEMHRHLQDEHLELPKCRKEDLFSLLQFYKPSMDLKSWDDYVGQMAPGKGQKTRLESVMNGNAKK